MKPFYFLLIAALPLAGCVTSHRKSAKAPPQELMSIQSAPIDSRQVDAQPAPTAVRSSSAPEAVYRMPKFRKVNLEPYVDENGVAYGPQVKYVMEDPGQWNMDALRNPAKAYIPPAMAVGMSAPASYVVPNTGEEPQAQPHKTLRDLYNLESVEITGFVERGQEPLAREMAAKYKDKKMIPYFDDKLGWVLIPDSALQPDFRG